MSPDREITFGPFRLDEVNECLWRGPQAITIRPKAFAVLKCLLGRAGQLVTKEQLLKQVWPDIFVSSAVLKDSIRQLREALGDRAAAPQYIETAHRRGYRFIAQVIEETAYEIAEPEAQESFGVPPGSTSHAHIYTVQAPPVAVLGRETALAQMRSWLEKALRAESQIVFVTGETGIGKSTLVEAFLEQAADLHEIWIARGQCLEQYGAGEAYLPVLDGLSRLGREPDGKRIIELLRRHAPTWLAQMPGLTSANDGDALQKQTLGTTREHMLREMSEAIEALTAETPLLLVLEDLHWSDYSTLDLVSYLARRRYPARLMLIGTYRPVEVILSEHPLKGVKQEMQMHGLCRELPLEYLTNEAVAEFLMLKFPCHQFPTGLARMIHQRTEGNPLFMVKMAEYLVDEKIIVEHEGNWRLQVELDEVELGVPENIRQLVERQIERLSSEEQRVLEGASVVGMDCSAEAISAGLGEDVVKIEELCDGLARRHYFLLPAYLAELPDGTITPRYRFIHALYLNVLYNRVAATRRSQIHARIGERGEAIYGDRVGEIAAELAVHFEQARDWMRAVKYLQLAAENAARRTANHEAVVLARRGLELLKTLPKTTERTNQELMLGRILHSEVGVSNKTTSR
jgi:predicted ATPase/DNA-binding winged helix-turn-helix (wHTH) protein